MLVSVLRRARARRQRLSRAPKAARPRERAARARELDAARARVAEAEGAGAELDGAPRRARHDPRPRRRHAQADRGAQPLGLLMKRSGHESSRASRHRRHQRPAVSDPQRARRRVRGRPGGLRREKMQLAARRVAGRRHAEDRGARGAQHRRRVLPGPRGGCVASAPTSAQRALELERMLDLALGPTRRRIGALPGPPVHSKIAPRGLISLSSSSLLCA